ncbi:Scm-like with four MBT domains protein 2 [Trichinella pseudospiralis]|uniref:Scm-like with four MBT domains protein 2 n=1 Tax=Trichinella pseudospiralis TaxID=6337 RepID=A0A0V0Y6S5_TRIPS|nr:Scm-like with four MBT domains protein 2 [Trichinella pseudospiralis]
MLEGSDNSVLIGQGAYEPAEGFSRHTECGSKNFEKWEQFVRCTGFRSQEFDVFSHLRVMMHENCNSRFVMQKPVDGGLQVVDVQDEWNAQAFWPAEVLKEYSGWLCLRYLCVVETENFWLPNFSIRLHESRTYANHLVQNQEVDRGCYYKPPGKVDYGEYTSLSDVMMNKDFVVYPKSRLMKLTFDVEAHGLRKYMAFEMLDPREKTFFFPAIVTKILNEYYFEVYLDRTPSTEKPINMDNVLPEDLYVLSKNSLGMVHIGYCDKNGIPFAGLRTFNWNNYKRVNGLIRIPFAFFSMGGLKNMLVPGRMVEVANTANNISLAAITACKGDFAWVLDLSQPCGRPWIVDCRNFVCLFPCGWSYVVMNVPFRNLLHFSEVPAFTNQSLFIYLNERFCTSSLIRKDRFAKVPGVMGPGTPDRIMQTLLEFVANYLLRCPDTMIKFRESLSPFVTEAKIVKVKVRTNPKKGFLDIPVCVDPHAVKYYLRHLCDMLGTCRYTFTTENLSFNECPERCSFHPLQKTNAASKRTLLADASEDSLKKPKLYPDTGVGTSGKIDGKNSDFTSANNDIAQQCTDANKVVNNKDDDDDDDMDDDHEDDDDDHEDDDGDDGDDIDVVDDDKSSDNDRSDHDNSGNDDDDDNDANEPPNENAEYAAGQQCSSSSGSKLIPISAFFPFNEKIVQPLREKANFNYVYTFTEVHSDPLTWTPAELYQFLEKNGFAKTNVPVALNGMEFDAESLIVASGKDLKKYFHLGEVLKLLNAGDYLLLKVWYYKITESENFFPEKHVVIRIDKLINLRIN